MKVGACFFISKKFESIEVNLKVRKFDKHDKINLSVLLAYFLG